MRTVTRRALAESLQSLRDAGWTIPLDVEIPLERPKRPEHGDLATNLAMTLPRATGRKPREIAEALATAIRQRAADDGGTGPIESVEIAGPGFLNLRLRPAAVHGVIAEVLRAAEAFGRHPPRADGGRTLVEFVSANPTGPMHLGHARGAVVGDVLVRLLRAAGYDVSTEYYINDRGHQVAMFGHSVRARAAGREAPEGGYGGAYVAEVAEALRATQPELLAEGSDDGALSRACVSLMMTQIEGTLTDLGVVFDRFVSERAMSEAGQLDAAVGALESGGFLEARDGALFFKSAGKGDDDKDRVLRKSAEKGGDWTYFATDIAYHADKMRRGFGHLIDIWGADHHGYVARVRAALEALGLPKAGFEVLLLQLVKLIKEGKEVKFSKRAGNFITIDEVLEEIDAATGHPGAGRDALRFLILSRSHDSAVELDIDVAKKQSVENPVFYAQMSHARMCSILRRVTDSPEMAAAREAGVLFVPEAYDPALGARLTLPEERDILALCDGFPELVREAAESRGPHRVVFFVLELAQAFASYFTRMQKVYSAPILPQKSFREAHPDTWVSLWDWETTRARLLWVTAVRQVYANALGLLGIEAPTQMSRDED